MKRILNAISDNPSNGELVVQHPRMNEQRREPVPVNAFTEYVNRMLFCDNVELSQQVFTQHPHSHHHSNNLLSQYEVGAAAAAAAAAETPMSRRRAAPPHPQGTCTTYYSTIVYISYSGSRLLIWDASGPGILVYYIRCLLYQ